MGRHPFIALLCGASLALGCVSSAALAQDTATTPTIVVTAKWQRQWDKGSAMERKALDARAEAQKALTQANSEIIDAQNKRDNNRERGDNASAEFRQLTASIPEFADGAAAAKWAATVGKAADRWKTSEKRGDKGSTQLDKAMKDQARAQKSLDKAQADIERGRALMTEAERASAATGAAR